MSTLYAVVDLEATTSSLTEGKIIQIGITLVKNQHIQESFCFDINPGCMIPSRITELTGITNAQVKQAPYFEEIADYLHSLLTDTIFVAHNLQFDYNLLKNEFARVGMPFHLIGYDTIDLARILLPSEASYALSQLSQKYGFVHQHVHNAGSDAYATAELFLLLQEKVAMLPSDTKQMIKELLQKSDNPHVAFFEQKTSILPAQSSVETNVMLATKKKEKPAASLVSWQQTLVDYAMDSARKEHLFFKQQSDMLWQLDSLLQTNTDTILCVVAHTQERDALLAHYAQSYDVHTIKSQADYIQVTSLDKLAQDVSQLRLQEVLQICGLYVWLLTTQTGDLDDVSITPKLREKLAIAQRGESPFYQKAIASKATHRVTFMSHKDFIAYVTTHADESSLKDCLVILSDTQHLAESLRAQLHVRIPLTNWFQKLLQTKQQLLVDGHLNVYALDKIIEEHRWFMRTLFEAYPFLSDKIAQQADITVQYFLDSVQTIDKFLLLRLKKALEQQLHLIDDTLLQRSLSKHIDELNLLFKSHDTAQYIGLTVEKSGKYFQYFLDSYPYTMVPWLKQHLYSKAAKIVYMGYQSFDAMQQSFADPLVTLVKDTNVALQSKIVCKQITDFADIHKIKENLLVRKLVALLDKQIALLDGHTLVLFTSQRMMEKVAEDLKKATYFMCKQPIAKQWQKNLVANQIVMATWRQYQQLYMSEPLFSRMIIVRLPFDAPDSLHAQASSYYLKQTGQHYFEQDALPTMLLRLQWLIDVSAKANVTLYSLDKRLTDSPYSQEILHALAAKTQIENCLLVDAFSKADSK